MFHVIVETNALSLLFAISFINNHQICNNNHEIHIDTSDKKKNRKKIQRLRYDWQWRRYTFTLVTRPLCALTKRRTNWFSSGATTPSIRINLCIILLYREILFTKSLDSSSMREEKKKKKRERNRFRYFHEACYPARNLLVPARNCLCPWWTVLSMKRLLSLVFLRVRAPLRTKKVVI